MYKFFKRAADLFVSLIVLLILSPIILTIGFILSLQLKKTPFFLQNRPGLNHKIFKVIKFQTMLETRDENGHLLEDHLRITRFGKFLRKSSLDELPQLFNVFIGNMSFVGPRPLLVEYLDYYSDFQKQRHNVRPGITGWAQVNGRNAISWEEKFNFDITYIQNQSFLFDFRILLMTIVKVLKANDIQTSETITMEKFKGTHE